MEQFIIKALTNQTIGIIKHFEVDMIFLLHTLELW